MSNEAALANKSTLMCFIILDCKPNLSVFNLRPTFREPQAMQAIYNFNGWKFSRGIVVSVIQNSKVISRNRKYLQQILSSISDHAFFQCLVRSISFFSYH